MNSSPTRLISMGILLLLLGSGVLATSAQTDTGALCISTFADTNGNGMRDQDEIPLPGVNVNLATNGMIIATHITETDEQSYCFESLQPGIYTLTFTDSPTYRTTTSNEGTFALADGQRLTISEFGAVPVPLNQLRAEVAAQIAASQSDDEPLDSSLRLLISTVGAMMVMLFMIGVGAVILGTISGRRRRSPYGPR